MSEVDPLVKFLGVSAAAIFTVAAGDALVTMPSTEDAMTSTLAAGGVGLSSVFGAAVLGGVGAFATYLGGRCFLFSKYMGGDDNTFYKNISSIGLFNLGLFAGLVGGALIGSNIGKDLIYNSSSTAGYETVVAEAQSPAERPAAEAPAPQV